VWWISSRGEGKLGVDNIGIFEDDGTPRKEHPLLLEPSPGAHRLHIARGFALVGDDLYIANACRKDSYVARYCRKGDMFHFAEVMVTAKEVSAMVHPSTWSSATTAVCTSRARTPTPSLPSSRRRASPPR
jgi:hypothetical protein